MDVFGISAYASASICAGIEIAEDVREIGHGHGIVLLTMSKLFKEVAEVRRKTEGLVEDDFSGVVWKKVAAPVLSLVSNAYVVSILAAMGLVAAWIEVTSTTMIGGHHGAMFLAIHDLIELLEESSILSKLEWIPLVPKMSNPLFMLTLVSAGLATAVVETIASFGSKKKLIGAHHGVLILSLMKVISAIALVREGLKEKEE